MFDFKGLTAGEAVAEDNPMFLRPCFDELGALGDSGKRMCYFRDAHVAGIEPIAGIAAYLHDGKFVKMDMRASSRQFAALEAALATRYGQPCRQETEKWRTGLGAVYDSPVITWCFRTGNLVLAGTAEGQNNVMELRYLDNAVAPPKPEINF
jgi:hypothetical protein